MAKWTAWHSRASTNTGIVFENIPRFFGRKSIKYPESSPTALSLNNFLPVRSTNSRKLSPSDDSKHQNLSPIPLRINNTPGNVVACTRRGSKIGSSSTNVPYHQDCRPSLDIYLWGHTGLVLGQGMAITSVSAASAVRSLNAPHPNTANYSSSKLLSFSFSSLQLPVELRLARLANGGVFSQSRSRISPLVAAKKQTFSTFDELLTNSDKPVFVEFYATWCGPCKFMNPILNEVSLTLKDTVQLVKIDTEKYPSIANKYQIEALPTFILFKEGKPYDRFEGALTKDHLIERIENLLNVKR